MESLTSTVEEYLEKLFWMNEAGIDPTQANLARAVGVSQPTALEMVRRLVDDGFVILGGPVGEGDPPEETLHAVEAADEDEIRARLARDPWARAGLLRVGSIEPWALWLGGRPG